MCKSYEKIALKIDEICTKVACMLHSCGIQIWLRFTLVKICNNKEVISVPVNHTLISLLLKEFVCMKYFKLSNYNC